MPRSPRQETSTRKKKYEHSPSDDDRKSSRNYKNFKHSGMLISSVKMSGKFSSVTSAAGDVDGIWYFKFYHEDR